MATEEELEAKRVELRKLFADEQIVNGKNWLELLGPWVSWPCFKDYVSLDGEFTIEQLEAIVWWMKNAPIER